MTERLATLLQEQATGLPVPPVPAARVLSDGRALRRRRRTATAVASLAAVAVAVTGAAAVDLRHTGTTTEPARHSDHTAYERLGAWATGDRVYVGGHATTVAGVQQLQYTTAGVVATGSDGSVLVTPAGKAEPLDLHVLDSPLSPPPVATDPTSPYLAYVRTLGGHRAQAVVRDVATGDETRVGEPFRTRQPDGVDWISGDLLSYARGGRSRVVDWRTGAPSRLARHGWWQASGVSIDYDPDGTWTLSSFAGRHLLTVSTDPAASYGTLSPDGRYFAVSGTDPGITVYDLAGGTSTTIEDRVAATYGWSPDGHLVGRPTASSARIESCDAATDTCDDTGVTAPGTLTLVAGTPGAAP